MGVIPAQGQRAVGAHGIGVRRSLRLGRKAGRRGFPRREEASGGGFRSFCVRGRRKRAAFLVFPFSLQSSVGGAIELRASAEIGQNSSFLSVCAAVVAPDCRAQQRTQLREKVFTGTRSRDPERVGERDALWQPVCCRTDGGKQVRLEQV